MGTLAVTALAGLTLSAGTAAAKPILMPTLQKAIKTQHAMWAQHVFAPLGSLQPPAPP